MQMPYGDYPLGTFCRKPNTWDPGLWRRCWPPPKTGSWITSVEWSARMEDDNPCGGGPGRAFWSMNWDRLPASVGSVTGFGSDNLSSPCGPVGSRGNGIPLRATSVRRSWPPEHPTGWPPKPWNGWGSGPPDARYGTSSKNPPSRSRRPFDTPLALRRKRCGVHATPQT